LSEQLVVVDTLDFSMRLDVWVLQAWRMGNLKRAVDMLGNIVAECFASNK